MHVVECGNVSPKVSQTVNRFQLKIDLCKIPHLRCVEFEDREFVHHYMYNVGISNKSLFQAEKKK